MSALFDRLYADLAAPLLTHVRHKVGDPEAAEDICQEVWAKLAGRLDGYAARPGFHGPALVYRTATNKALDHLRRGTSAAAGGRITFVDLQASTAPGAVLHPSLVAPESTEDAALADDLVGADAALALELLPGRARRVLWLREWRGYAYADIAAAEGETVPAVKSALYRARALQRERWAAEQTKVAAGSGVAVRFWRTVEGGEARADDRDACWRWVGWTPAKATDPDPAMYVQGRTNRRARRIAWALVRGVLPPWARLSPACPHRWCVSPWHAVSVASTGRRVAGRATYAPASPDHDPPAAAAGDLAGPPSVGAGLRRRRLALGLRLDDVAARAGLQRAIVSDAERGRGVLPRTLLAIAAAVRAAEGELRPTGDGPSLRARRLAAGITRTAVARAAGLGEQAVTSVETERHRSQPTTLRRLADALDRLERERADGSAA